MKTLLKLTLFGFFVLASSFAFGLTSKKALAFSTTTPIQASAPATNSANITGSGTSIQPWFAVGEGAYDGTFSYAKVYVPKGGSATLTVSQGNGVCGIDVGSPSVKYEVYTLLASENLSSLGSGRIGLKDNSGGCGALTFALSGGVPSSRIGHGNYDVYYFQATIVGPGVGDNEKNFRLSVSNGLIGVSRPVANLGTKPWFGIYMRDAPSRGGNNWDYAVQSAPYCGEDSGVASKSIAVHDIDWQVYNQPNLEGLVDKDDRSATGFNWVLSPPGRPSSDKLQNDWPVGNGTNANLTFAYSNTNRYLLEFRDVEWHNTIQISLPFDQFDAQANVGQACSPQNISCTVTPATQTVGQNSTGIINIQGKSDQGWKSTYFIKRTGPTSRDLTTSTTGAATDSVIYTGAQTVTYSYVVWDSATNAQVSQPPACTGQITWKNISQPAVTCEAQPTTPNPSVGASDSINFTIHNNGTTNLQGDQVRQKASDSANTGAVWPQAGFGNFSTGQQASFTFPVSARGTAKVVTFTYTLYSGTTAGDSPVVGVQDPLPCNVTITWGNPPQGFQTNCSQTTVPGMKSSATYTHTTTVPGGTPYRTDTAPDNYAQFPNGPSSLWVWSFPPTLQKDGFFLYTPPPITVTQTLTATKIPIQIRFSDGSTYNTVINGNPTSPQSYDTFNTFTFLRPHLAYTATLFAQTSGSLGAEQNGPYGNPWTQIDQPQPLAQCLHADANACLGGNSPAATPGSVVSSTYKITIYNLTNRSFDSSVGYNLLAHPDGGGLVANGSMSQGVAIGTGQTTLQATFSFTTFFRGSYWVEFRYQNNRINNLPGQNTSQTWPGTCGSGSDNAPPVTITPTISPYFQVWGGDSAAGGGFRTVDFQCPTTYPDYVSPPTASAAGKANSQYYGGIRGMRTSGIGSKDDFGAVAMGWIPGGSGGADASAGFLARNNAYFANNPTAGNLGGFLNSNSSGHCVDDYYTNTQIDPGNTPSLGDLQTDINNCPLDTNTNAYRCQFQTTGTVIGGSINIPAGHQITLYIDGDVTIDGNITYQEPFNPSSRADVPYFALIVRGNIILTNNATRLDGLYVAQPTSGGSGGEFDTCTKAGSNFDMCTSQLVVNGAVIAQRVKLVRAHGSSAPLGSDVNGIGTNPGEIINFVPSMIIGAPMFNPQPNSPEGLFSLPPVF